MGEVDPEVQQLLRQLTPILLQWYRDGTLGEVAIVFGPHEIQPEERPRLKHEPVKIARKDGRRSVIAKRAPGGAP